MTDAEGVCAPGLVEVSTRSRQPLIEQEVYLTQARSLRLVDYVFFQKVSDSSSLSPAAYVVENTDFRHSEAELASLHRDVWLQGIAPLIYVFSPTRIDILTCARGADFWDGQGARIYSPAETIKIGAEIDQQRAKIRQFSADRLADGTFWEDPKSQPLANYQKAAHESIIQAIVETDAELEGAENPALRRLLLLMVLIKYLEDRGVFPGDGWFGRFEKGARTFFDVLRGGNPDSVTRLLGTLESRFNGEVFCLPAGLKLTKKALKIFADLVEARTLGSQRYLWEQHTFKHLPVEVISNLYQRFVPSKTAVYTPPFLAALLLDQTLPYVGSTGKERILDPACGSGIFLVGAFKRLVNIRRAKSNWRTPKTKDLQRILSEQLIGVDLNEGALDLAAFSLALAICDVLQPDVIWKDLRFENLRGKSLFLQDYFEFADEATASKGFDVIIGNPPFESEFTLGAQQAAKELDHIPDKQTAYLFFARALKNLKPNGVLCLIQPHGFLYNLRSHTFRKSMAANGHICKILDFTSIRNLYDGADVKTVAVMSTRDGGPERIPHLTFRRTFRAAQRLGFELDHYDYHFVTRNELMTNPRAARPNLLGGGRLKSIADRLSSMRSFREFVDEHCWLMAEGFIEGNKDPKPANYIAGKPFLPTSALTNRGIDLQKLDRVETKEFQRPRRKELFQGPLILIKENVNLPMAFWKAGPITYKHKIIGIHAPESRKSPSLRSVFRTLIEHHELYRFSVLLNGSQALLGKSTAILKADIERLPFPAETESLNCTYWEKALIDDTLQYTSDYIRLGQNSELLKRRAAEDEVNAYAEMYTRLLSSIFDNIKSGPTIYRDDFVCQAFYFGDQQEAHWDPSGESALRSLLTDDAWDSLQIKRVIRVYNKNVVFIIKPQLLRYWIRSTAIRDADETLVDLREQGF